MSEREIWLASKLKTQTEKLAIAIQALKRINDHWVDYELSEKSSEAQIASEALERLKAE